MKFPRFLLLLVPVVATALLAGCASTNTADANKSDVDSNGERVSTVPWNRPSSWEQGGALGAAMGQ